MLLRSLISAVLCVSAAGCAGISEEDAGEPAGVSDASRPRLIASADPFYIRPSETKPLRVTYLDAGGRPVVGADITFGLSGTASGASFVEAQYKTDGQGDAYALLRAGSTLTTFQVRASADQVEPLLINVQVIAEPSVSVSVSYDGQRNVVSRSVSLVSGMSCAGVTNVYKDEVESGAAFVLFGLDERAEFKLSSGGAYALVAWGSDDTNGKLAYGCVDILDLPTPDLTPDELKIDVPLKDTELGVEAGSFGLALTLDVEKPLAGLKGSAEQTVLALLPKKAQPGAAFYLDALEGALGSFAGQRSALGLDLELETLLSQANGGPLEFGSRLAQLVAAQGSTLSLQASLAVPQPNVIGTLEISRVEAVAAELARAVPLTGALAATTKLTSRYDGSRAAIVIDSLSVQLGLGSYATWLLDEAGPSAALVRQLSPAHGCPQVSLLVSRHSSLPFTPAQAEAACQQALVTMIGSIRSAWQQLDVERPSICFQGLVPVHDRDLDQLRGPLEARLVDDIGPAELKASWSSAFSAEPQNAVSATLRVPPSTALAL